MRRVSQILTVFLTLILGVPACAPSPAVPITTPQAEPTAILTAVPSTATTAPAAYETSVPAVLWGQHDHEHRLVPLDPSTGEALPGYGAISLGRSYFHAFSPDRRTLVALTYATEHSLDGSLLLVDLAVWKARRIDLKLDGWAREMTLSHDGSLLAISHGNEFTSTITLFDLKRQILLAQRETDLQVPRIKFTSAGDALMLSGLPIEADPSRYRLSGGSPHAVLLDAANLSERWRAELEGVREGIFPKEEAATLTSEQMLEPGQAMYLSPGLAFAPDRDALYIVHADSDRLTIVDFEAQSVETREFHAELSWFERLLSLGTRNAHAKVADGTSKDVAVSPDGQFLYVAGTDNRTYQDQQGNWQLQQTPLGLQVIRIRDGSRLAHVETKAGELWLSPDGRFVYLRSWGSEQEAPGTEVFDTSKRQIITRIPATYLTPARRINGEALLTSTYSQTEHLHHMLVLRPADLSVLADWKGPDYVAWLTVE